LGRRSALWSDAPIEAEKKLRDLVIQAVTKGAAGFHRSTSKMRRWWRNFAKS
jgi:hypothetical protein